jgi:predicted TIM-barrel fold metal-dependent hydrolase
VAGGPGACTATARTKRGESIVPQRDFLSPPVVRYRGPMVDAHLHVRPPDQMSVYLQVAEAYGVRNYIGIADRVAIDACRAAMPGRLQGVLRLSYDDIADPAAFRRRTLDELKRAVQESRVRGVKFWFKPEFNARTKLYWDDARLDFLFDFMVERRLVALVHVADPDAWFRTVYRDTARFKTKAENYNQLENRMRGWRDLVVQAAHLGGDPEHLDHLARLLETYPNLHLDLSATKWMARELSARPEESRTFVIRWADRLLWGSDLVVARRADMTADDYATRYWVHRHLWEGRGRRASPIEDADAGHQVQVAGLDLPMEVLEKIYCRNAARLYRFEPVG